MKEFGGCPFQILKPSVMSRNISQAIARHPFAAGLAPEHLEVLAECAMPTQFAQGEVVLEKGDLANRFYLIESGRVSIEWPLAVGCMSVETLGAGDVLGWSWLFEPYSWHFRACALEPTEAIFFYGTRLRTLCEEDTGLGYELVKRIARVAIHRLEATQHRLTGSEPAGNPRQKT